MLLPLHTVHILWRMKLSFCQHLHFMKTLQNNKKVINRYGTGTFSQCCGAGKKGENIFKAAPEPVQESIFIQPEPPF